jgi:hypothetical protein
MLRLLVSCLAVLLCAGALPAAFTVTFTIDAGKHDRSNVPVCVPIALPADLAGQQIVWVCDGDRDLAIGQITSPGLLSSARPAARGKENRELHFILPALKAGSSLTLKAVFGDGKAPAPGADVFQWHDTPGEYSKLRRGGRPVLRYVDHPLDDSTKQQREQTYKVYHHLYDPAGERLVTKGPGGLYTHHRGLFYGFRKVRYGDRKEVDIWHCTNDTYQGHERILASEAGPVLGRQRVLIAWHGVKKEVFAREEREVTVYAVPGGVMVDWVSRLKPTGGPVLLDGDPQHAGFHFRADNEVAAKTSKETIFIRPDGSGKPGETRNWPDDKRHVDLPWDAMSFVLGGKRYTVAYLDRPENPKEARYSERNYGRFGSYFVHEVTAEKPLTVAYRIWLQEGQMTGKEVAARSEDFVDPVRVTVK